MAYLTDVERQFDSLIRSRTIRNEGDYATYLQLFSCLSSRKLLPVEFIYKFAEAFADYPEVLISFNVLIPPEIRIDISDPSTAICDLVSELAPDRFKAFSELLNRGFMDSNEVSNVFKEIEVLFDDLVLIKKVIKNFCNTLVEGGALFREFVTRARNIRLHKADLFVEKGGFISEKFDEPGMCSKTVDDSTCIVNASSSDNIEGSKKKGAMNELQEVDNMLENHKDSSDFHSIVNQNVALKVLNEATYQSKATIKSPAHVKGDNRSAMVANRLNDDYCISDQSISQEVSPPSLESVVKLNYSLLPRKSRDLLPNALDCNQFFAANEKCLDTLVSLDEISSAMKPRTLTRKFLMPRREDLRPSKRLKDTKYEERSKKLTFHPSLMCSCMTKSLKLEGTQQGVFLDDGRLLADIKVPLPIVKDSGLLHRIFNLCLRQCGWKVAQFVLEICRRCTQNSLTFWEGCSILDVYWPILGETKEYMLNEVKCLLFNCIAAAEDQDSESFLIEKLCCHNARKCVPFSVTCGKVYSHDEIFTKADDIDRHVVDCSGTNVTHLKDSEVSTKLSFLASSDSKGSNNSFSSCSKEVNDMFLENGKVRDKCGRATDASESQKDIISSSVVPATIVPFAEDSSSLEYSSSSHPRKFYCHHISSAFLQIVANTSPAIRIEMDSLLTWANVNNVDPYLVVREILSLLAPYRKLKYYFRQLLKASVASKPPKKQEDELNTELKLYTISRTELELHSYSCSYGSSVFSPPISTEFRHHNLNEKSEFFGPNVPELPCIGTVTESSGSCSSLHDKLDNSAAFASYVQSPLNFFLPQADWQDFQIHKILIEIFTSSAIFDEFPSIQWMKDQPRYRLLESIFNMLGDGVCFNELLLCIFEWTEGLLDQAQLLELFVNSLVSCVVNNSLSWYPSYSVRYSPSTVTPGLSFCSFPTPQNSISSSQQGCLPLSHIKQPIENSPIREANRITMCDILSKKIKTLLDYREDDRQLYYTQCLVEQNYESWEKYGESYRKIPHDFPNLLCSGRDKLCLSVLNDEWASIPDSSESIPREKTESEEALFAVEDERYVWDLKIGWNDSLRRLCEYLALSIATLKLEDRKKAVIRPSTFDGLSLIGLKEVFGDNTAQVISSICCAPIEALPLVHSALKVKEMQWKMTKSQMEVLWRLQELEFWDNSLERWDSYKKEGGWLRGVTKKKFAGVGY